MMSMNLSNITILNVDGVDFCCIISGISKSKAVFYSKKLTQTTKFEHFKS